MFPELPGMTKALRRACNTIEFGRETDAEL